jgi:hydroxymethylpyrimidine/phosphomethylpyrimidine kinase
MLGSAAVVREVVAAVRRYDIPRLVVDPVMLAQSGARLVDDDAVDVVRRELMPLAMLITPNAPEAEVLAEMRIESLADQRAAARALISRGARAVLLKGGHLSGGDAIDILDDGQIVQELRAARVDTRHTHGSGCQLSAAIAAGLARGSSLTEAVIEAKRFISVAIAGSLALGGGSGPANPLAWGGS